MVGLLGLHSLTLAGLCKSLSHIYTLLVLFPGKPCRCGTIFPKHAQMRQHLQHGYWQTDAGSGLGVANQLSWELGSALLCEW